MSFFITSNGNVNSGIVTDFSQGVPTQIQAFHSGRG